MKLFCKSQVCFVMQRGAGYRWTILGWDPSLGGQGWVRLLFTFKSSQHAYAFAEWYRNHMCPPFGLQGAAPRVDPYRGSKNQNIK